MTKAEIFSHYIWIGRDDVNPREEFANPEYHKKIHCSHKLCRSPQVKYGTEEYKVLIYCFKLQFYHSFVGLFVLFFSVTFPHSSLSERPKCSLSMATHQQQRPNYTPVNSSGVQLFSLNLQRLNTQNPGKEYKWILTCFLSSAFALQSWQHQKQ